MAEDRNGGQQRHWGKRLREDAETVRFSDLSAEQKMQRRKRERQEKKERERTLSYFKSVQRTMDEHASSSDPTVLANIVDGFFGELLKLLQADPSFHLLRNGVVCRAIEAALGSAGLLQGKTLLYVFLGHVVDLVTSPVASYTFETLVVSLALGLSALSETNPEGFDAEMTEGGPGTHVGSGVPSTATLLRSMTDELVERAEDLLVHEVGSRALRSLVLVLGGHAIRNAPPPTHPVVHPALLGALAEAAVAALEEGYGRECRTASPAEAWLAAAQVPQTSFVVQSLLRVSEEGGPCYAAVAQRLEGLLHKNKPLLWHLMTDRQLGSHLFQAYLRAPMPPRLIELGDAEAIQVERRLRAAQQQQHEKGKKKRGPAEKLKELARDEPPVVSAGASEKRPREEVEEELLGCCWGRGLRMVQTAFSLLVSGKQLPFLLQDLVLGAPTAAHLHLLWEQLLARHLSALLAPQGNPTAGAAALAAFARKCAFAASERGGGADGEGSAEGGGIPADLSSLLRADEGQGVRYFSVSADLQRAVCEQICAALARCDEAGSAAHYLLLDGSLGDRGAELARCLLHLHPAASRALQADMAALAQDDVLAVAVHHKGSLVLQQYLRAAAYWTATGKDGDKNHHETAHRFLRKVEDRMYDVVYSKYGAFVVETLYEVSSVATKEAVVQALLPIYDSLKDQPEVSDKEESMRRHVARKVMTRCCVEQYTHRHEDWLRLAQRQVQVQRLMWRMMLDG